MSWAMSLTQHLTNNVHSSTQSTMEPGSFLRPQPSHSSPTSHPQSRPSCSIKRNRIEAELGEGDSTDYHRPGFALIDCFSLVDLDVPTVKRNPRVEMSTPSLAHGVPPGFAQPTQTTGVQMERHCPTDVARNDNRVMDPHESQEVLIGSFSPP